MKKINAEEFVKAWQSSLTLAQAAEKMGKTKNAVATRGSYFRKHGVPLKKLKRAPEDWDKLKELAKSLS